MNLRFSENETIPEKAVLIAGEAFEAKRGFLRFLAGYSG